MPLQIIRKDITTMHVDAIVNTTNEEMIGYSGVDYAVHEGAGPLLDEECKKLAPLGLGEVKLTRGYDLDAKYIIHTAGPIWRGGLRGESIILKSCYLESLRLAVEKGFSSVAFPLISSGAYGYPKDQVLKFAVSVISEFLLENELMVYICVRDKTSYKFSRTLFNELIEFIGDTAETLGDSKEGTYNSYECQDCMPCCRPNSKASKIAATPDSMPQKPYAVNSGTAEEKSLHEYLKTMDKSFAYKLFDFIDKRGMTDVECYKKANVDKKTFSKIKCNPDTYRPSKQTAVAFAIALRLDISQTQSLLASAGLTLSESFVFDRIIRYFIQKEIYDIFEINEALFEFDQILLGC